MSSEKLSEQPATEESQQQAASVEVPRKEPDHAAPGQTCILHLSDLHFGRKFVGERWTNLLTIAEEVKPDLIVVSGDVVDHPLRWKLSLAREQIAELKKRSGCAHEVVFVPGNHDVRIGGILPVRRLILGALLVSAIAGACWYSGVFATSAEVVTIASAALAILAVGLFGSFEKKFGKLEPVTRFEDLGLELFRYDSANHGAYWAEGFVTSAQFPQANDKAAAIAKQHPARLFRIGVVHHHALPIPYAHDSEPMMVLRNAGMFLHEAATQEIPLVLHGHRHKFSFGRVTLDAHSEKPYEIAVLSTGSATAGWQGDRLGHNFNVITLNRWRNAEITRYQSPDGRMFAKSQPFLARTIETATRDLFVINSRAQGFGCDSLVATIEINADGDAHRTMHYRGLRVQEGLRKSELPGSTQAQTSTGHIERIRLTKLAGPPAFNLIKAGETRTARTWSASIRFDGVLENNSLPLDFQWEYHAINSFATSAQQYRIMYPAEPGGAIEWAFVNLRNVPVAELIIVVKLPAGFAPVGMPQLAVQRPDGTAEIGLQQAYGKDLVYEPNYNVIVLRLAYPPLDLNYRLEWPLPELPSTTAHASQSLRGGLTDAVQKMLKCDARTSPLNELFGEVANEAVSRLKLGSKEATELELNIMAYDEKSNLLKIVAANFAATDPRWGLELRYGDGIAGRCYKLNRPRVFVKQIAKTNDTPYYYAPLGDQPVSDDGREVTEEVVVSLPLYHPDDRAEIFAVLNLSSPRAGSGLADLREDQLKNDAHDFIRIVASACLLKLLGSLP